MIDTEMPDTSETRVAAPPTAEISPVDVLGEDGDDAIFVEEVARGKTASPVVAPPTADSSTEGGFDRDEN